MEVNAFPYRFGVVPIKHMTIDVYQRPLTNFVDKIEKEFNPALVGTLAVSERSSTKYAVIDGQTRAEGMRRRGFDEAPCVIYEGLTLAQEAELFALFQTQRRSMNSAMRFKAEVIAGHREAQAVNEIVEAAGFRIDYNRRAADDPRPAIPAVAALEFIYRGCRDKRAKLTEHPELLAETLYVIQQAWPNYVETATSAFILRGLGFYLVQAENLDQDRLIERLRKITPSELAKRAEALKEGRGLTGNSPAYLAEAIESVYRKRG